MFYKVSIYKQENPSTKDFIRQDIYIESDKLCNCGVLKLNASKFKKYFLDVIIRHQNELSDKCIYDETLHKNGYCAVDVLPFPIKPNYLSDGDYIKD